MGEQGQIEVLKDGRRHRRYRTPKAVLRALELASARDVEQFTEEQILEWINASAPLAASTLINQLRSRNEVISQNAAIKILEWAAGKPKAAKEDGDSASRSPLLPGRRIEIIITDPDGNIIDESAVEGGAVVAQQLPVQGALRGPWLGEELDDRGAPDQGSLPSEGSDPLHS